MLVMFGPDLSCVMYADDLIPVSASVNLLQRMIDTCREEAVYLECIKIKYYSLWTEMY